MSNKISRKKIKADKVIHELIPGQSMELLKELHLLTNRGDLNADCLRKLKQINHLIGLLTPYLPQNNEFDLIDCGAGNSHLGLILYEIFYKLGNNPRQLYSIERRQDLFNRAQKRKDKLCFERMLFIKNDIAKSFEDFSKKELFHSVIVALHACDTASDEAILLGLKLKAKSLAIIPCCQREFTDHLKSIKREQLISPGLSLLWNENLHCREFSSHLTNLIRLHTLKIFGYKTTVTEFVGPEHSLKNELILAKNHQDSFDKNSLDLLNQLLSHLGFLQEKYLAENDLPYLLKNCFEIKKGKLSPILEP